MDILKKFGQQVRIARLSKGMSQGKLAKKLNIDPSYISQVERGQGNMSVRRIEKLAIALNVSISELFQ